MDTGISSGKLLKGLKGTPRYSEDFVSEVLGGLYLEDLIGI